MTDRYQWRVRGFLAAVYVAGAVALGGVLGTAVWHVPAQVRALLIVASVLLVLGELLPIRLWSHGSCQEYTISGAFALVLLQTGPLVYAVLLQIVALLIVELRDRAPARVTIFNVAQNVLMFVFARFAICAVEGVGFGTITGVSASRQLAGFALAAVVYFAVNNILTGTIVALTSRKTIAGSIVTAMRDELRVTPIVLGLAPMIAASLAFSVWTAPLCLLLIVAIRTAVTIATRHEIAALHDPLTGLPNRSLMLSNLRRSLRGVGPDRPVSILMIDLDYFKEINDTLGHAVGDELLKLVADRLTATVGPRGTVARLGGDEFAVVLEGIDLDEATALAGHIAEALCDSFGLIELSLTVTASVGVAAAPAHGADADTLIRRADLALYSAKQERGRHAVYNPRSAEHSTDASALMNELRLGIERDELVVYFQPKVNIRTGRLAGVEALVRWRHPTRGILFPGQFLPGAENTPLIVPLTERVIDAALTAVRTWREHGLDIAVSVNLTARQVHNQDLPRQIELALAAHGLRGDALVVEVTESCLMANPVQARAVLNRLRGAGVALSIDDFGTGYSSFTHLRDLPVTEIKIDKSFVAGAAGSTPNAAIVKSVIELGHNLGLQVVAEGVETQSCLRALTGMGCDIVQGHFIGYPMPAERLLSWYAAGLPLHQERVTAC